jgi:hypothetical protein
MNRLIENTVFSGFDGRRRAAALGVRDHGRLAALEHRHRAVGGAEIDADCLCHTWLRLSLWVY